MPGRQERSRSPSIRDVADSPRVAHDRAAAAVRRLHRRWGSGRPGRRCVYAASEGLSTVIVEREAPGGQAGQSASIENYLGFPKGLSGSDLAQRAFAQALSLRRRDGVGARGRRASRVAVRSVPSRSTAVGEIEARSLLVATGVAYRRLAADGAGRPDRDAGSTTESTPAKRASVRVMTSTSSARPTRPGRPRSISSRFAKQRGAGRHAPPLSRPPCREYLVDRIMAAPNIEVRFDTEVVAAGGDGHLERAHPDATGAPGGTEQVASSWLFIFIGASPRTDWLGPDIARDEPWLRAHGAGPARRSRPGRQVEAGPSTVRAGSRVCPASSRPVTSGSTR